MCATINLKFINIKLIKKKMDNIKKILKLQNINLLKKIAEDKFNNEEDKIKFIERYNKLNYRNYKIIYKKNNLINNYKKIIDKNAL